MELEGIPHVFTAEQHAELRIDARTELLGGIVYDMSPENDAHRYAVNVLSGLLNAALFPRYLVQTDGAVAIPDWQGTDAPRPDIAVIINQFRAPTSADALVFVEVADSTYMRDRNVKIPLYVRAEVPAFIVNIGSHWIEAYFTEADIALPHGQVHRSACTIFGVAVEVARLFKPA